ncbi:uncharacterized protein LOC122670920 isoform X2 [Telopea speciosissima]|uniref:uncharacterized protein LOC122670920 isoform X2 n=1 Tax=Telopea speciosissima TaxID=54955 RepID=UPI001CC81736|nr:uncharacterized protein LOC122670920 isoform X2 [Telopea speciosissima]
MDPSEPYWRTNSSFSPPLSGRGDYRLQSEGLPYARHNAVQLYGSSLSSNSKESRGQWRDDNLPHHQYSASDRFGSYFSSPSDSFQTPQWTPPPRQGVNIDDYVSAVMREPVSEPLSSTPSMERTSAVDYSAGSSSSGSDGSEYGPIAKMHTSSNRNSSSRRLFMSKPIHPVAFPNQTERETHGNISTGNTVDLSNHNCLEQTTPKTHKLDPPCPLCVRSEEIVAEHGAFSRLRNGFSRLKSFREEGPSRPWGCGQVGDCVEGALHAPPRNTLVLLNQSRLKKHHSLNSNSSKGVPDKLKKNMSHSSHILNRISVDHGAGGCSKIVAEPALKRC